MMVIQDLAKIGDDLKFKMAVIPIHGKNHSDNFFSRTTWLIWLIFCMKNMRHLDIKQLELVWMDHKPTLSGWGKFEK